MPKVYRLMKADDGKPAVGTASMMLGARASEIPVHPDGTVHPGTEGISVFAALSALLPNMVPRRLHSLVPGAAGSNAPRVWSMSQGKFEDAPVTDQLRLRIDPLDSLHGFLEPAAIMTFEQYQSALAATRDAWMVDEA